VTCGTRSEGINVTSVRCPPAPTAVHSGATVGADDEEEGFMYQAEVAKTRVDDLVRAAEAHRRVRETRAARAGEARGKARRIASSIASLVIWPIKH
jgi:hypothetical protein